jgi:hypothetical protein
MKVGSASGIGTAGACLLNRGSIESSASHERWRGRRLCEACTTRESFPTGPEQLRKGAMVLFNRGGGRSGARRIDNRHGHGAIVGRTENGTTF